jgi:hypothetical protein
MELVLSIDNIGNMSKVNDVIHDCYFELRDIHFEEHQGVLSIKFNRILPGKRSVISRKWIFKKVKIPEFYYYLKIENVLNWQLAHQGASESWDYFNIMKFNKEENLIIVKCVIAAELKIWVSGLKLNMYNSGKIANEKIRLSIW